MRRPAEDEESRLTLWLHVRRLAVPPSMIERASARRAVGDWAGACRAAHVDVDLNLRSLARARGTALAAAIRADLRLLAPDLLRGHLPRGGPDHLLRSGLTLPLAWYDPDGGAMAAGAVDGAICLVVRTPPAWAAGGQRISLTLWQPGPVVPGTLAPLLHPRPRPSRRHRLDLHRHLWDARRTPDLPDRTGRGAAPVLDRWADEARIVLRAAGPQAGSRVLVHAGGRVHHVLEVPAASGPPSLWPLRTPADGRGLPMLPAASVQDPLDLRLLAAGRLGLDELHPLVARALGGPARSEAPTPAPRPRHGPPGWTVECRGARHRVALVDGVLAPLDHSPDEVARERLLVALTGEPLSCLRSIDEAHREPEHLAEVVARLVHGDVDGALDLVQGRLGPDAALPPGPLRDALDAAVAGRVDHGRYRAGLSGRHRLTSSSARRPTPPRP